MIEKFKAHARVLRQVWHDSLRIGAGSWNCLWYLCLWYLIRLRERRLMVLPGVIRFRLRSGGRELLLPVRTGSIVDLMTLRGIFSEREYELASPPWVVRRIVDLGANCGFASAYFAARFPDASIVAVEPDPANLVQLALTVSWNRLPVTVVSAAVAPGGRPVFFAAEAAHSTRGKIGEGRTGLAVCSLRLEDVLKIAGWSEIDILKVDIEGVEGQLFADRSDVSLERVRRILFELHAWGGGGETLKAVESRGFSVRLANGIREQVYLAEKPGVP